MHEIFPSAVENVDSVEIYAADKRVPAAGRPWVMANMISSIDGAVEIDGLSGGLGGPADKAIFSAIRGVADVIIAGAGTVIAENYRRPQTSERIQQLRVDRGQSPLPRIAIVSNSWQIDPTHRAFDKDARPLAIAPRRAPADAMAAIEPVADIVYAGDDHVDLPDALSALHTLGANVVLVEGGPMLNAAFVAEDLLDEFCLSFSPMLAGGNGDRVVGATDKSPALAMTLDLSLIHI